MANQACFIRSVLEKMCPIQSLVSLLSLLADVISTCIRSPMAAFTPLPVTLETPFSLPCHSLLHQLSSRMFSHHCNSQRRDGEVGWPIHMKYSACLPPLLVQSATSRSSLPVWGAACEWSDRGRRGKGVQLSHSPFCLTSSKHVWH